MTFSDRTNNDLKKKEKREREKKTRPEVGESDPFRGVMFNQGLSAMQPHVWERPEYKGVDTQKSGIRGTTIDKKAVTEMEQRICERCGVDVKTQKHQKGCPALSRPLIMGEMIDLNEWEKNLWAKEIKEIDSEIVDISKAVEE